MEHVVRYLEIGRQTGVACEENALLAPYCTFGTGGKADALFFPETEEGATALLSRLEEESVPCVFLGNGSNVLVSDDGVRGAAICFRRLKGISVKGKIVTALAGDSLSDVIELALLNSLGGMEFLSGIPASVGGAVAMNAGCFNKTIAEYVSFVRYAGGVLGGRDCRFSYRDSIFRQEKKCVLSVCFHLENVEYEQSESKIGYFLSLRRNRQPKGRTCGSTFRNDGFFAGKVIENCGLKGYRVGGAVVSEKHANFIVAGKNATSSDIYSLIARVKKIVWERCGIRLREEVEYIGKFKDENQF